MESPKIYEKIFDEQAATGFSKVIYCGDVDTVTFLTKSADTASFTFKFFGAIGEKPDTTETADGTRTWDYVSAVNLNNVGSNIVGDTGVTVAANQTDQFEININNLQWIGVQITSYTSGNLTVDAQLFNQ